MDSLHSKDTLKTNKSSSKCSKYYTKNNSCRTGQKRTSGPETPTNKICKMLKNTQNVKFLKMLIKLQTKIIYAHLKMPNKIQKK